jgi:hypothetical protein
MLGSFPAERPAHPVIRAQVGGRLCRLALDIGDLGEVERVCGATIGEITLRFARFGFSMNDIAEVLRLALQRGGDCTPAEATAVMNVFIKPRLLDHAKLAERVLMAALSGLDMEDEADPQGKAQGLSAEPATSGPSTPPADA